MSGLLRRHEITQADLARGIQRSEPFVSRLVRGGTGASQLTIQRVLAFLSVRLQRSVTFEEAFGGPGRSQAA